jgi:hypothetical protein
MVLYKRLAKATLGTDNTAAAAGVYRTEKNQARLEEIVLYNSDAAAHTVTLYITDTVSGAPLDSDVILVKSLAAGETFAWGLAQSLSGEERLVAIADAAAKVNLLVSGLEFLV